MKINFGEIIKGLWPALKVLWPLLLLLVGMLVIKIMIEIVLPNNFKKLVNAIRFRKGEKWRSDRDILQWLRGMKPVEFENYIADLFLRLGYKTRAVGKSHDGGVDVVAEKDGIKHYIQCKKFITSQVTVHDVRDFYGALVDKLADGRGFFITTNKFTLEAEKFAEDKPIELIDSYKLINYIHLAEENKDISERVVTKKCPKCNGDLIKRKSKFGEFYGCSNYPKCRFTKKLKA